MNTTEKTLRVLSIEDSEDDFELIRNELTEGGFKVMHKRVEAAELLKEALECGSWDVVICDHNLPRLDSMSALKIVREVKQDLPFIVVSGDIPDALAIDAMHHGARDFIRKDNLSRLVPVVERELHGAIARAELDAMQKRVHHISHFDSLTGLPNREHLFRHLEAIMHGKKHNRPFAVFVIDLSRFRKVTKTLGILAGDQVILEMSKRLCMALGEGSFIARVSTDRFVAVMPHLWQEAQAREVAIAVHQCMSGAFQIDGQELFVKVCLGVSFYPKDGQQWSELFKNAESALYGAKADGGGSYQAYKPEMDALGKERLAMETALYHALEDEQFVLYYQPQYDLLSGRITGTEALIRWRHPEFGMILPGEFISILEETGLIVPVGEWVLRTACARNKQWQDAGLPPVCVAVNLSATQFRQPDLPQTIRNILKETGLSPEYLELEITENIAMHAEEEVIAILNELRMIGIQIAIDDFGTGYSSLSYLKRFPIDRLKIDRSFVRDHQENSDNGIITAIIGMGHGLKLKVIAEGVETQVQADFLKLRGCDEVQGYFYGRPMEDSDFAALMTKTIYPNKKFCEAMV